MGGTKVLQKSVRKRVDWVAWRGGCVDQGCERVGGWSAGGKDSEGGGEIYTHCDTYWGQWKELSRHGRGVEA